MDDIELFDEFTSKQIELAHYVALGANLEVAANACGIQKSDARALLKQPEFTKIVDRERLAVSAKRQEARALLIAMSNNRLIDILAQDYGSVSEQEKREIARTARFVLGESKDQSAITQNTILAPGLVVNTDGAEIIARHLASLSGDIPSQNDITVDYKIEAAHTDYTCHPETQYGVINFDTATEMSQCHVCGKWVHDLNSHISQHGLSFSDYRTIFKV